MSLLCPKCHNEMHQYERNGVVVDQCTECKGLFLDRGELEKLVKAENGWYGDDDDRERRKPEPRYEALYESRPRYDESPRYEPRPDPRYDPRYDERRRYDDDSYRHSKKHKRRSFLEELFD
ncbi:MAG TPA: zf-TFIIB domain-containing protein [Mycobacteriales bacterium]|nr:zf-TFIIB domain-containing protein [Mycobacteriales bacterium]